MGFRETFRRHSKFSPVSSLAAQEKMKAIGNSAGYILGNCHMERFTPRPQGWSPSMLTPAPPSPAERTRCTMHGVQCSLVCLILIEEASPIPSSSLQKKGHGGGHSGPRYIPEPLAPGFWFHAVLVSRASLPSKPSKPRAALHLSRVRKLATFFPQLALPCICPCC